LGYRAGSPLLPQASRKGGGPKAGLHFTVASIRMRDRNRIAFYKTTSSGHDLFCDGASAHPLEYRLHVLGRNCKVLQLFEIRIACKPAWMFA
jgi:hypothetical protein